MYPFYRVYDFRKSWLACSLQRPLRVAMRFGCQLFGFATLYLLGVTSTSIASLWGSFLIRSGGDKVVPEFVSNSLGILLWRIKAFLAQRYSCTVVNSLSEL